MAEQILFNNIADVLTKLGSSAVQRTGSAFGVGKELRKLEKKLATIKGVLVDAEKRQQESDAVKSWVRRLKDVVYDADDLLDDFETLQLQKHGGVLRQVSNFFSSSNQLLFRFKMSDRVNDIKDEVDAIVKEIPLLNLIQGNITHREVVNSWRETHSFVLTSELVERDEDKEEIIKLLVSSGNEKILSAVAIVGIGGLGKTTLAQLVYNDKRVVEFFEPKIWVCVSDDFDVKLLVTKILEPSSGGAAGKLESLEVLKDSLHEKLSQKRYLLVLDDVWNDDFQKWDRLKTLLMVGATGSKILVTTRNRNVASAMGIDHFPFYLKGLKESQSWNLFSKIAFEEGQERMYPRIVEIGKEIVNMCNGVPLIIKTLGAILRYKADEFPWLAIKNNENLLLLEGGNNDGILSVLKLSYDDLPFHLKQCFVYCALFPKDYEIEKKMLVKLWMAQGYIQASNVGNQYFEELLSRSLLEEVKKDVDNNILSCKMHDLIHDLAKSIVGFEVLVLGDNVDETFERVYHVSFYRDKDFHRKDLKIEQLRTVLKFKRWIENYSIESTLIPNFRCSRMLSLYGIRIQKVPKSISKLTHLRYLDLSFCPFEVLPDAITRLYNLQTLELSHCQYLKEFPKDTKELINLRHLENDRCSSLSHMPCGIGELTLLESLPVFPIGTRSEVGRLSELKRLNNLQGELMIQKLENIRDAKAETEEASLGEKQYIQALRLEWSYDQQALSGKDDESVMTGLRPHQNLKMLSIIGYGGARFPSWMMNDGLSSMLPNLSEIVWYRCSRCQILPSFVELPHLKFLELSGLEKVEHMDCSSEGPFFPSLENLHLSKMPKLKELWRRDLPTRPPPPSFPCLSKVEISDCADLASILLLPCPLLSQLRIWNCGSLASLELHSFPSVSTITIGCCARLTTFLVPPSSLLEYLEISFCRNLASLELHSSLDRKLLIRECPKLTSLSVPPSPLLSYVEIRSCVDLASLELYSSPSLSQLEVSKCPKLTSLQVSSVPCLKTIELDEVSEEVLRQFMLSTTVSSLESLYISSIDDLMSLPNELHQHVSTLQNLQIKDCSHLATLPNWIGNLTSLTTLGIGNCPELASLPQDMRFLSSLTSLKNLSIASCPQLTSFPEELRSLRSLKTLRVFHCSGLTTLPDWIGSLSSLEILFIIECPKLTSLPEEMRSLTNLKRLFIFKCPYLWDRCQKEIGEDWPKIAHVPQIDVVS